MLPIMRVASSQQAVDHCNSSRLALQGCVFTQDINAAILISDSMETGSVQVCQASDNDCVADAQSHSTIGVCCVTAAKHVTTLLKLNMHKGCPYIAQ